MLPAPRARSMPAPPQRMVARVVAAFALLVALFATRGAAASERLSFDRVIEGVAALQCAAAQAPSGAGSRSARKKDASLLGAQPQPSVQARPESQPEPNGKHVDDDGVVGGDVIALPAPVAVRGEGEGVAVRAGGSCGYVRRLSDGVRAAHPVRGPPVSSI